MHGKDVAGFMGREPYSEGQGRGKALLKLKHFSFWTCNWSRKFACFLIVWKHKKTHKYQLLPCKMTF